MATGGYDVETLGQPGCSGYLETLSAESCPDVSFWHHGNQALNTQTVVANVRL